MQLAMESGIHRIQRVPPTEKRGRRQTSTVAVAVMECDNIANVTIDQNDVRIEAVRGSGPGGQHRNTRDTAIRITHIKTGISAYADGKSQHRNKVNAMSVLSARLSAIGTERRNRQENAKRREQIGDMGRGSRIRTYNLFRGFVKDERVAGKFNPNKILNGYLNLIYDKMK